MNVFCRSCNKTFNVDYHPYDNDYWVDKKGRFHLKIFCDVREQSRNGCEEDRDGSFKD